MEDKALVPMTLSDTLNLGKVLAESGFFSDTKAASQAVVKVLAGRELGFGPIASMTGIHIVQGKPSLGANLLGAAIKGSHRYNYRVVELTDERAEIAFFEEGKEVGRSTFTIHDAKKAQLTGKPIWAQYPRNMLFSRALSNGARWFCPDVFSGVIPYTPEELGADIDGETGEVINVTPAPAPAEIPQKPATATNGHERPLDAATLQRGLRNKAAWFKDGDGYRRNAALEPITEKQVGVVAGLISKATRAEGMDQAMLDRARHDILQYLFNVTSTNDLTKKEASAIIDWLAVPGDIGEVNEYAQTETARILTAVSVEAGQQELPL